jgi:hypothetical protein
MNALRNALNSLRSTAAFSAAWPGAHRPVSGNSNANHTFSVQALPGIGVAMALHVHPLTSVPE